MPSVATLMVVLVILMMFFGVGKLPDVLKQFGKGVKEFKDASEGLTRKGKGTLRDEPGGDEPEEDEDDGERAAVEEFKRKRKASKQLTAGPGTASSPARVADRVPVGDDADGSGDNDDAGSTPRSR
ncbi:MAG: hypothetical protein EXR69_02345 [Myxococcales bacterium]|nr:hypothetical protein [Myxococcales bacterium]